MAAHRQFLSTELARLCDAYFRRPEGSDAELMVESDPFTDGEELPTSFRVESTSGGDAKADVLVALSGPGTVSHRVTVALVREGGAWKIANLSYGDGPTFRDLLIGHR